MNVFVDPYDLKRALRDGLRLTIPSGGVSEAPIDGQLYGRENANWVVIPAPSAGADVLEVQVFS